MSEKVRENRLRRMARRQGWVLEKSPRRDRRARDYGLYRLLVDHRDIDDHRVTTPFQKTIAEVEAILEQLHDNDEEPE
jgi:predicted transcriptional regulator